MTGYGRGEASGHGRRITVEVRSVNNRYLDCNIKLPRAYIFAEDTLKKRVGSVISRGKVDVFISLESEGTDEVHITLNRAVADGYYRALEEMDKTYGLQDSISLTLLSRFPDVFTVEKPEEDLEQVSADICAVLDTALEEFSRIRSQEGARLAEDILGRADTIEALVGRIEERSPQTVSDYRARLEAKMQEVLENKQLDESRILTEAAIFADKVAVDEETVRLRSHLEQLRQMLEQGGATGRKLDFLIQEFNREANTIGSKCSDIEISRWVVDLKGEIEKIREQVQNIE